MRAIRRAAGMDPFEDGLSTVEKFCRSNSTIDQRTNSASSEATGSLERRSSSSGPEKRRRHIVRSGGRKGTEIITGYEQAKTSAPPCVVGKRPWEESATKHNQPEESLAQAAVERLSERCSQILQIHAEAKHRKAQNIIHANELPYASPEYLLELIQQATLQFLDDKVKIEGARRPTVPSLSTLPMHPPMMDSVPQFERQQLHSYSPHQHFPAPDRRIRPCQRAEEPYLPEQVWKDTILDEAWNCQSLDTFSECIEDFLPKMPLIDQSQQLPWT